MTRLDSTLQGTALVKHRVYAEAQEDYIIFRENGTAIGQSHP